MQSAPPVSVRGSGGRGWPAVQAGLGAAAAASFTAWGLGWLELGWPRAWLVAVVAGITAAGVWLGRTSSPHQLAWDGQRWCLDGGPGRLDLMIDLDRWVLLRFVPDSRSGAVWPSFSAAEAGPAWHGLRVALYARVPSDGASAPGATEQGGAPR